MLFIRIYIILNSRWVATELPGSPLVPEGAEDAVAAQLQAVDGFVSGGLALLAGDGRRVVVLLKRLVIHQHEREQRANGRSWAIGGKHTKRQQECFQSELLELDGQLGASGGPFLNGDTLSVVHICSCAVS